MINHNKQTPAGGQHGHVVVEGNNRMSAQYLSDPWWTNDDTIHPEEEHPPQEAFFRAEFAGAGEARFQIAEERGQATNLDRNERKERKGSGDKS